MIDMVDLVYRIVDIYTSEHYSSIQENSFMNVQDCRKQALEFLANSVRFIDEERDEFIVLIAALTLGYEKLQRGEYSL